MFAIVAYHYFLHGTTNLTKLPVGINSIFANSVLELGGRLGVGLFIVITGYFCINRPPNKLKIIGLSLKTYIYSFGFVAVVLIFGLKFSKKAFLLTLLPPPFQTLYWFISAYIIFCLAAPFLNQLIKSLTKQTFQNIIIFLLIIWVVIPFLTLSFEKVFLSNLEKFLLFYLLGAYIRLYPPRPRAKFYALASIVTLLLNTLMILVILIVGSRVSKLLLIPGKLATFYPPFTLLLIIFLFLTALSARPRHIPYVNTLAGTTLGIYILHENPLFANTMWRILFNNGGILTHWWGILFAIGQIATIFLICALIDYLLWTKVLSKPVQKMMEKYVPNVSGGINHYLKCIIIYVRKIY